MCMNSVSNLSGVKPFFHFCKFIDIFTLSMVVVFVCILLICSIPVYNVTIRAAYLFLYLVSFQHFRQLRNSI